MTTWVSEQLYMTSGRQQQFLRVLSREEAMARFQGALDLRPLEREQVPFLESLGRVLADDTVARVDVPAFDRANVDGFAIQSRDTAGASPQRPGALRLTGEVITPGCVPKEPVETGTASIIATGGMIPRGADAVVLVEKTELEDETVLLEEPVAAGSFVTYAGSDMALGETALHGGQVIGSREVGLLAALGFDRVPVWRRPRVAIISTGNELIPPGRSLPAGGVYDSNAAILAAAVTEQGCEPVPCGIAPDEEAALEKLLHRALDCDVVLLSGGTSKGEGDVAHRVINRLEDPGVLVHGVALRPGKPLCLAVHRGKPVVVLPGFPTSAIFTFHEFVAPVLRALSGMPPVKHAVRCATIPLPLPSELGRTDYRAVGLVRRTDGELMAYPMPRESGAVTTYSRADGFVTIPADARGLSAGAAVDVRLIDAHVEPADLTVIGSHCVGLDYLLGCLQREGFTVKSLHVGSTGGLAAARRGDCDLAGIHLLDPGTDTYNRPLVPDNARFLEGYQRLQGIVFRPGDVRFEGHTLGTLFPRILGDRDCVMVNRNAGSGTRHLLDRLLGDDRPTGYNVQPSSHNAVAAAVAQGRADWGMAIQPVAQAYGLGFIAVRQEHYDFVIPADRWDMPAVRRFRELLSETETRVELAERGFTRSL